MSKFIFDCKYFKIRETLDDDVNHWYKWFNDSSINKYLLHGAFPNTLEKQKKFRRDHLVGEKKIMFSILNNRGKKLIGTCSINIFEPFSSRRCEISLIIGDKKFHKGNLYINLNIWLINHAFKELGMNSILAAFFEENLGVKKTLEVLGFKKIGLERARFFKNDNFHNVLSYDLLKKEWKF
jgi:RimJ/RimL family protein N-acetyltransferase